MQKYLLYRKGLRMACIDQDEVRRDAKLAISDWIERSRLLLDETERSEAFTFRFVEMRGYKEGLMTVDKKHIVSYTISSSFERNDRYGQASSKTVSRRSSSP